MEILTKENLVRPKTAPAAVWRTLLSLLRETGLLSKDRNSQPATRIQDPEPRNSPKKGIVSVGPEKKTINKKTCKQNFHGIVPGLSRTVRDCPGIFLRFPGNLVHVFPFSPRKTQHKQVEPHPFLGILKTCLCLLVFAPPIQGSQAKL